MPILQGLFGPPDIDRLFNKRDVQGLIKALNYQKDDWIRINASSALSRIRDPKAVEPLIKTLQNDRSGEVRKSAASVLGHFGDERAVKPLIAALRDEDSIGYTSVSFNAKRALIEIGKSAVEPLIGVLKDDHEIAVRSATEALGEIRDTRAVEPLIALLQNEKCICREEAAEALGEIGDTRAVEPLIALLQDEKCICREEVAEALGKIGDVQAVEPLVAALSQRNLSSVAAKALGQIKNERAIEPLGNALKQGYGRDEDEIVAGALRAIGSKNALKLVVSWLLEKPVFEWIDGNFEVKNYEWKDNLRADNKNACYQWDPGPRHPLFVPSGDKEKAEYYFSMAQQAQNSGDINMAQALYHRALRCYCDLGDEERIGLTCFNLGKVYGVYAQSRSQGVKRNWEMAQLMFLQSAHLNRKTGERKGYAWSLLYLGDTYEQLGDKLLARQFVMEALPVFQEVLPEEVPGVKKALNRLSK